MWKDKEQTSKQRNKTPLHVTEQVTVGKKRGWRGKEEEKEFCYFIII